MKVFLVSGRHWLVPGVIVRAAASQVGAQIIALEILNLVRSDLTLPPVADFGLFEDALREASFLFQEVTESDETAEVWIDEVTVEMISDLEAAA
jgi:hypothetical protein